MAQTDYYALLESIHRTFRPERYVEIGVRKGESWRFVSETSVSVGIDPATALTFDVPGKAQLFEGTSDAFFAQHNLRARLDDRPFDLAFIDGMHLFEFALRDFINLERHSGPQSIILIHDCLPIDAATSARERTTQVWSGDVYKLIVCLKRYRPDLHIVTLDAAPTGLAVVTHLDSASRVLSDHYDAALTEFQNFAFASLGDGQQKRLMLNVMPVDLKVISTLFQRTMALAAPAEKRVAPGTNATPPTRRSPKTQGPSKLGVLLCYNDADILPDAIEALLKDNHALIIWDHGSTDSTADVISRYLSDVVEHRLIPRSVDFYGLYEAMSENLIQNHIAHFDWISWPDQDEILEGPNRTVSYADALNGVYHSGSDYLLFDNFNFWFTNIDDSSLPRPVERIRHYALFSDCAPRVRSWRASKTNIRHFNHNPLPGTEHPIRFALRHYPMRSEAQMQRRLAHDRKGLMRGGQNYHYQNMLQHESRLYIDPHALLVDDGVTNLNRTPIFNWRTIYGGAPEGLPDSAYASSVKSPALRPSL